MAVDLLRDDEVIEVASAEERIATLEARLSTAADQFRADISEIRSGMASDLTEMRAELRRLTEEVHNRPSRADARLSNLLVATTTLFATGFVAILVAFLQHLG